VLPSVFLSIYLFGRYDAVDLPGGSRVIPATYAIEILRGIILRGAGVRDLWVQALVLTVMVARR